jgi:hypothetical protein
VIEAMLNPNCSRMTKETRQNRDTLYNQLTAQLRRVSLVGAVQNSDDRRQGRPWTAGPAVAPRQALPLRNSLMPVAPAAPPVQRNALFDVPSLLPSGTTQSLPLYTAPRPPSRIVMPNRPPHAVING